MTALSAGRISSTREVTRDLRPLAAGAKVYAGALAIAITSGTGKGYYKQGVSSAIGHAVGRFTQTVDNTNGAAGDLSAEIHFFHERHLFLLDNDTGTALTVADRESQCQVFDDHTVTGAAGTMPAGVVYDVVTGEGVWVEVQEADQAEGPTIQSGTSTLASGTKSVTGVTLTSSSIIVVTMRDPGSGAVTGLGALDVPVSTRNTGAGSFVVNAIDDSKAVITTVNSTFDWLIVG